MGRWTLPFLLSLCLIPSLSQAKDLRSRVGVGVTQQTSDIPTLSIKYGLPTAEKSVNIQLEAVGGAEMLPGDQISAVAGLRVLYGVVAEDNMNLYAGAGVLSVLMNADDSPQFTGVRIQPVFGAEFFPYGLENLGLSLEGGVSVDIGEDGAGFSTRPGSHPLAGFGFHYYF